MKILIVSAWYSPAIHPRAHRWANIASHWAAKGHSVTVLTSRHAGGPLGESMEKGVRVIRVGHSALHEAISNLLGLNRVKGGTAAQPQHSGMLIRVLYACYQWLWKYWIFPDDAFVWYFPARTKLYQLIESEGFDRMITVSMPFTGHCLGLSAKRKFADRMPLWLADIGDPFSSTESRPFWHARMGRKWERCLLHEADVLCLTTAALQNHYLRTFNGLKADKFRVIPPLFVPYTTEVGEIPVDKTSIAIGYFGHLYYPVRPPEVFLHFLSALQTHHPDLYDKLEFHFYGDLNPLVKSKIEHLPNLICHGLSSREHAAAKMQSMDILLNIGNRSSIQLPSKAVDYLASGRPVLHLSLTEDDPFSSFFHDHPAFFSCPISEKGIITSALEELVSWLQSHKKVLDADALALRLAPYGIVPIANAYLVKDHNC